VSAAVSAEGLVGDDYFSTNSGDDRIDGGDGHDEANASYGDDICVAVDVRVSCSAG